MSVREKILKFVREHAIYALYCELYGFDPIAVLAQSALESGWGESKLAQEFNNYFGIKGKDVVLLTQEYEEGEMKKKKESFARFKDVGECYAYFVDLIRRRFPRAWSARGVASSYFVGLQNDGYATDPDYARKCYAVYETIKRVLRESVEAR